MKMLVVKVYPEDGEVLADLFYRMRDNIMKYVRKNGDTSTEVLEQEDHILVKSLKLEENVN